MRRTRPLLADARHALSACIALWLATAGTQTDAAGQQGVASVSGVVEDPRGALLPGVLVTLTNSEGARRNSTTLSDGSFRFANLPEGRYDLDMSRRGFTEARTDVTLEAGHTVIRPVTLRVAAIEEYIRISMSGTAPAAATRSRGAPQLQRQDQCVKPIGGCVQPPMKIVDARPQYPSLARVEGIEGLVIIEVTIDAQGLVDEIKPQVAPDRDLVEATVAAVRQWQFSPALLNGVPIESVLNVTAEFVTDDR